MATTSKKPARKKSTTTSSAKTTATKTTKKVTKKPAVKAAAKTAAKQVSTVSQAAKPVSKAAKPLTMLDRLNRWNWVLAVFHAVQAALVLWLAKPGAGVEPITTSYLTRDSLASTDTQPVLVSATHRLFDVHLAWIVAAFFIMSALAHLSIATWYRKRYERDLQVGINRARWIEYSLSASTMMVAIGLLAGIYDISTLLLMFGATAVMNLCGLVMEVVNQKRDTVSWVAYVVGCVAGVLPWLAFLIYILGSRQYGEGGGPPTFVYYILVSIFLFFNSFAYNMYLQYKKRGRWADYMFGEKAYMILSLVAKAALAWQVFGGTLRP